MKRPQRGFTLIELMVALLVSSLLVGMILAIFSRMSLAYRGQQQIAGVQQVLAAARATIELDAKQAGLAMAQGFRMATSTASSTPIPPVRVINSSTGPDQIAFFYADTSAQAKITSFSSWASAGNLTVDAAAGFVKDDLIVISKTSTTVPGLETNDAAIATYDACVAKITAVAATTISVSTVAPWGATGMPGCGPAVNTDSMVYKFVARAYKIDRSTTDRQALGPLQMSPTGALIGTVADDGFIDLAYGFTDIQTALQVYNGTSTSDLDGDGDMTRNWVSNSDQNTVTVTATSTTAPVQMSISLVARTDRDIEGISTAATPQLVDPARIANNSLGDRASVALPSATDESLKGSRIYRYTTFQVDLRNIGVGR